MIDFEPQAGFDPVEGESINNAFMEATYGISFHMDDLNGIPPIMVRTGSPQLGFVALSSGQNCGSGATIQDIIFDGDSDCFFISDTRTNNPPDSFTFFIDYIDNCCGGASGELLDIDFGETWLIRVYTPGINSAIAAYSLCEGGLCDFNSTGDGDGSLWVVDISPDPIDYISFTLVDQDGGPGAGMGIDNIDYCISTASPDSTFSVIDSCGLTDIVIVERTYTASTGCDSVHTIYVQPSNPDTNLIQQNVCQQSEAGTDTLIHNSASGCDSIVILESIFEQAVVELSPDTIVISEQPVLLIAETNIIPTSIDWQPAGPDSLQWVIYPTEDIIYTLQLTDPSGCFAESTVLIQVADPGMVYIPNAFSPNGDGINDHWQVYPSDDIEILKIEIFERWGNKVWESGIDLKWDGKMNGMFLDPNVMSAVVTYKDTITNKTHTTVTEIHLIR